MMKKICKTVCLGLALSMLALPMVGCEKDPGLYAWYGGKMDVDNVMSIHVNGAEGEKVYDVSFDTYRTVFVYLKNNVSDIIMNDKGEATALSTNEEKNLAIKEVAEDILTEYYALTALCEKYGITHFIGDTKDEKPTFDKWNIMCKIYPENYPKANENKAESGKDEKEIKE